MTFPPGSTPRRPGRPRSRLAAVGVAVFLLSACVPGGDEEAAAACGVFQEHLDQMRDGEEQRDQAIALAEQAAVDAQEAQDQDLATAMADYRRVIVRFALATDDVREAEQRRAVDGSPEVQDELREAENRLTETIQAGDLVLNRIRSLCADHDVDLG